MFVTVRTVLLCVVAPWLITLTFIINHKGIIGLPFALAAGAIGIIITRMPILAKSVLTAIYLCFASVVLVNYSMRVVCDYNHCERDERGQPLD